MCDGSIHILACLSSFLEQRNTVWVGACLEVEKGPWNGVQCSCLLFLYLHRHLLGGVMPKTPDALKVFVHLTSWFQTCLSANCSWAGWPFRGNCQHSFDDMPVNFAAREIALVCFSRMKTCYYPSITLSIMRQNPRNVPTQAICGHLTDVFKKCWAYLWNIYMPRVPLC